MKKVGVIGSGDVGTALSDGFLKHGYEVMRGTRDAKKLAGWLAGAKKSAGAKASVGSFADAAKFGELVVVAVKGTAAEATVETVAAHLAGKTVIDANNPIDDVAPEKGVLVSFTGPNESLMERLQKKAPKAKFVKAFSCVGSAYMVNPSFPGGKPTMFVCGDDAGAKAEVGRVLAQFGWDVEDMGGVVSARAIEPLAVLWCIPGIAKGDWGPRAFKLLKA